MARFDRTDLGRLGTHWPVFSFLDSAGLNCGVVSCCVDGTEVLTDYSPKVATDICGLNVGPDGKIYGSTVRSTAAPSLRHRQFCAIADSFWNRGVQIISMNLFCYDPATNAMDDLGKVGWAGGEVYDVITAGDSIFLGSYGGGIFAEFDPARPWRPSGETEGTAEDANPRSHGPLGSDMNRPFEYAVGPDGKIYIACRSNCECFSCFVLVVWCHLQSISFSLKEPLNTLQTAYLAAVWRSSTRSPRRRRCTATRCSPCSA